jgi:hypothetical protein
MATVICPDCGSPNPDTYRICQRCGNALLIPGAIPPGEGAAPEPEPRPAPEPRIVNRKASLFTETYRVTGELELRFRRLTDALSSETLDSFLLRSCRVTPLQGPPESVFSVPEMRVVRRELIFAVDHLQLPRPTVEQAPAEESTQVRHVVKRPYALGLILGGWQIRGNLHIPLGGDPEAVLSAHAARQGESFIPLTDARAVYPANPGLNLAPGTIIIRRDLIAFSWPEAGGGAVPAK